MEECLRLSVLQCNGESDRCAMIAIDQETGEKVMEPLRSLSRLQKDKVVVMVAHHRHDYHHYYCHSACTTVPWRCR